MIHHAVQTETQTMTGAYPPSGRNTLGHSSPVLQKHLSITMQSKRIDQVIVSSDHIRLRRPRSRQRSFSSNAGGSILPPVEDDITPNDAADAGDQGRVNSFEYIVIEGMTVFCGPNALWKPHALLRGIDWVAESANPD